MKMKWEELLTQQGCYQSRYMNYTRIMKVNAQKLLLYGLLKTEVKK